MSHSLLPQDPDRSKAAFQDTYGRSAAVPVEPEAMDLGEWITNLWEGKYLIIGSILFFMAFGVFSVWKAVPIYQIEAMLQIQQKKERVSDPAFSKMEGLFSEPTEAQAEIEILKSNLVLGRTVEALQLDVTAQPVFFPVVGAALSRRGPNPPAVEVQTLEVPVALRGKKFHLTALPEGGFRWSGPFHEPLGAGKPGDLLTAVYEGATLQLKVRTLTGKPGQDFILVRTPIQGAIADLRLNFDAFEKGKMTNVLGLTFKSANPVKGTAILNEIVNEYVRHKVEKKGGEAAEALAILQGKMPILKARLEESESRLNQFRSQSGSVDLTREAEGVVQASAGLASQVSALKQKKEELLRTYKENADVVVTVNEQIRKLQNEANQVDTKARALPGTQQVVVRLTRDVQVNQELYTALLNNMQQLQMASAGDVGSFDLVDQATPNPEPLGPKPGMQVGIFTFLGLLLGVGAARVRRVLRRGIKDHRLIESKLGIPVLVTIPHSKAQDAHAQDIRKRQDGLHLMTVAQPDDLATESLRSLRTVLHFSLKDAPNNVMMLTGPAPSIGKSFISANFAAVLAQTGAKILLVDGDLRRGNLHHYFGLKARGTGFADVLSRRSSWETSIQKTEIAGLDLLTTGIIPPNPSELLMSARFKEFLDAVSASYQYVIIDAPPLLAVTDATVIGARAGTVLLVAKFGQHPMDELRVCQQRLEASGIRLLGCIFNDVQPTGLGYLGREYSYAYHYTYKG